MTFNPRDPAALEAFLRERIREKTETDKLDFKRDLKFSERRERLEMVKDINALVNTFGLEYDDHGFLIFGMNREDGQVSHPVTVLDTLGTDKLEAQITELVHGSMQPAPAFNLYSFQEPGVGTWGAIVIWPNQPPPFVFSKEGAYPGHGGKKVALWQMGDWFMRRGARTVRPEPLDYAHMIQVRVQGAVAPLNARIGNLEYQLAHIQGQVTALQADSHAAVTGELLHQGQVVEAVVFTTPYTAGQQLIEPQRASFEQAIAEMRLARRTKEAPLENPLRTAYGGWADRVQTFEATLKSTPGYPSHDRFQAAQHFLTAWNLHGDEEDRAFPQAAYYRNQRERSNQQTLLGADAKRAQAYLQLQELARPLHEKVSKAAAYAPFEEFTLRLSNPSKKATGTLRVTITCTGGGQLHRFAPQDRSRSLNVEFPSHSADHVVPLEAVEDERGELLPGETWTTRRFAVKFEQEGTLNLHVRILAQHLPEGQELEFQCAVTAR